MRETKCLLLLLMEFEWTIIKRNQLKDYIQILLTRHCQNLFLFLTLVFWKGFSFWHFPRAHWSLIPNTMTDPGIWSWEIKNRQSALHKQKCGEHLADKCVPGSRSPNQEFWLFVLTVCYFTMRLRICLSMDSMSNGQEGLACCGPWGCKESDMTEWLHWTDEVTAVDSRNSCHIDILRSKWDMERNKKPLRKKEIGGMAKMKWHQEVYLIPH